MKKLFLQVTALTFLYLFFLTPSVSFSEQQVSSHSQSSSDVLDKLSSLPLGDALKKLREEVKDPFTRIKVANELRFISYKKNNTQVQDSFSERLKKFERDFSSLQHITPEERSRIIEYAQSRFHKRRAVRLEMFTEDVAFFTQLEGNQNLSSEEKEILARDRKRTYRGKRRLERSERRASPSELDKRLAEFNLDGVQRN